MKYKVFIDLRTTYLRFDRTKYLAITEHSSLIYWSWFPESVLRNASDLYNNLCQNIRTCFTN